MGYYNHSILVDTTIMVSQNCPIIGEHFGVNFMAQWVTIATVLTCLKHHAIHVSFKFL